MKKIILLFGLVLSSVLTYAQEFNHVPSSPDVKKLADGWYKFQLEGTVFDVEISRGDYVKGNIKWFDGSTYSGELAGTDLNGKGTYTWPDGRRYEGAFKKHQRHGKGSLIEADGTKWSGKWKANAKNGKGKIFDPNGQVIKEGVWQSDELVSEKN